MISPGSLPVYLLTSGNGMRLGLGFQWPGFVIQLGPFLWGAKFLFLLIGRLLTVYIIRKCSLIGILGGLIDRV